jgi:hypothetical protein
MHNYWKPGAGVAAAITLAGVVTAGSATASPAAHGSPISQGSQCLTAGPTVTLTTCGSGGAQGWTWQHDGTVTSAATGQCLAVSGGSAADNTPLTLEACDRENPAQHFAHLADGTLYVTQTARCVAVSAGSPGLQPCDSLDSSQLWTAAGAPTAHYTISSANPVSFGDQDDTPVASYTTANGQFFYQSSYSLYATASGRVWEFFTGSNFDTATPDTTLDHAVNPANPKDRNSNTTWRCNYSPTGREATYAPSRQGYGERNYCDLIGVWVDPDTGYLYGVIHNEFTPEPFGDGLHFDGLDYAVSKDGGMTWTIEGHIITSPYSTKRGDTGQFPNQTYYYGDGDPRLYVDAASGYFYVFYGARVVDKATTSNSLESFVARAPMSGKMATGTWRKWYDGGWNSPGIGGPESDLVPADGGGSGYIATAQNYNPLSSGTQEQQIAAGTMPAKSQLSILNITYDAYLGEYIGTPEHTGNANLPQRYYATKDLATQRWTYIGSDAAAPNQSWYRWFLDSANLTNEMVVGKTFRAYCLYYCTKYTGEYRTVTITPATAGALPVQQGDYRIASVDGARLGAGWKFTPTGDGFFTITSAASGQALGVNAVPASRAWGARATLQAPRRGAVGQEWFVERVMRAGSGGLASVPAGTFRLVNRYSGLALSLTGLSGARVPAAGVPGSGVPAAGVPTEPQRSWNGGPHALGGPLDAQLLILTSRS